MSGYGSESVKSWPPDHQGPVIDDKILDSFDIVSLIAEINNEWDVTIPADKIDPQYFNSAEALCELIEELLDE